MVEQPPCKRSIVGSIPTSGTNNSLAKNIMEKIGELNSLFEDAACLGLKIELDCCNDSRYSTIGDLLKMPQSILVCKIYQRLPAKNGD